MDNIHLTDLAGMVGVAVYLGSYAALQMGLIRGQGYAYASLNTLAAACVLVSMMNAFNLSSAIIQISWIVISVFGIARYYIATQSARFTDEEKRLLEKRFPTLDKSTARKVLNLGAWHTGEPNTVLTEANIPVPYLVYLLDGKAAVSVNGKHVAFVESDTFIGEMTALSGDPATATVALSERSRYFAIPAERLRNVIRKDEGLRREVEVTFSRAVREKLVQSNRSRTVVESAK